MDAITTAIRWLHIGAVVVSIGGAFFLRFILLPSFEALSDQAVVDRLSDAVGRRWRRVVHVCIAVILISGLYSTYHAIVVLGRPATYHALLGVKLLAALGVFFVASALVGRGPAFAAMRSNARRWLTVLLGLAALVVLIAGMLARLQAPASSSGTAAVDLHTPVGAAWSPAGDCPGLRPLLHNG